MTEACGHACRGSCTSLEACQKFWFANSNNEPQQTTLACQLWDDGPDSPSSYLSQQCSDGYEGPLCSMWSANHGVSGRAMPHHAQRYGTIWQMVIAKHISCQASKQAGNLFHTCCLYSRGHKCTISLSLHVCCSHLFVLQAISCVPTVHNTQQ